MFYCKHSIFIIHSRMNEPINIRRKLARPRSKTPRDRKKIMLELFSVSFTRANGIYTTLHPDPRPKANQP